MGRVAQERRTKNCVKRKGFTGELEENIESGGSSDNSDNSTSNTNNNLMKDFHTSGNLGRGGFAEETTNFNQSAESWEEVRGKYSESPGRSSLRFT